MGSIIGMDGQPLASTTNLPEIKLQKINTYAVVLTCPNDKAPLKPIAQTRTNSGVLVKSRCPECGYEVDLPLATGGIIQSPDSLEETEKQINEHLKSK